MISNLVALNLLTGTAAYLDRAQAIPAAFAADLTRNALGHCGLLAGTFDLLAPQHVAVIDPAPAEAAGSSVSAVAPLARAMFKLSLPGAVQQVLAGAQVPSAGPLAGKTATSGKPTAYACLGPQCSLPVTEPNSLLELLRRQRAASPP
jgi:uncharacterized protein YyaL (SSP411 family)